MKIAHCSFSEPKLTSSDCFFTKHKYKTQIVVNLLSWTFDNFAWKQKKTVCINYSS